jgi:neutral trehalase
MYDDIPFDASKQCLMLQDVGLNGMYVADCEALAALAQMIDRKDAVRELTARGNEFRNHMQHLWDEKTGMFLNRRTDTGEFSHRMSPTNFYALLAGAASEQQARRMIDEHLYNPKEFWGDFVLPSIARSDPAYAEQNYWRGRIWAPMNFLVYLGLRRSKQMKAAADLAKKSAELLLLEWRANRHVHENYDANNGQGCNVSSSDRFYHWGALLAMPALIEAGKVGAPEAPLT